MAVRFPTHLYDEARSFSVFCSGVALATLLLLIPGYSSPDLREGAGYASFWLAAVPGVVVLANSLAFARQGGFRRALPQLAGIALPCSLTYSFSSGQLAVMTWLGLLLLLVPLWPISYLYGYRISGHLERAALSAGSMDGWSRKFMGTDPALEPAGRLLNIAPQPDPWWRGSVGGHPATFASRVTWFVPVAARVDVASWVMNVLRWIVAMALTKQVPKGDYEELLARPATWIVVELPDRAAIVPDFRAVSRRWVDRDIVFGNVRDRTEMFESIELNRRYAVRVRRGADRLRTWQAFNVALLDRLSGTAHLVVAKQDRHLIVLRLHGAATPDQVDELHRFTADLVDAVVQVR